MRIPKDVILFWPNEIVEIPSLWVRETELDDLYPKAWGAESPSTTGGAATHTHTSPAHSHTMINHTHTYDLSSVSPSGNSIRTKNQAKDALRGAHSHGTSSSGAVSGGTTAETAVTYGAVSNHPPFYELIPIKAQLGAILHESIIALWTGWDGSTATPNNWQFCNGDNGSPDMRNKYLKCADTDQEAGTTGGSTTNTHDITHSHAATNHSHVGIASATKTGGSQSDGGGLVVNVVHINHTHTVTLADTSIAPPDFEGELVTLETVEPAYRKVAAIMMQSNGRKERGLIAGWLGSVSDIPKGWVLCDGSNGTLDLRDKFIKIANSTSEIGQAGGSNTHTHAAQSHPHGTTSHTHTGTASAHVAGQNDNPDGDALYVPSPAQYPTHTVQDISSVNASWNTANTTANSSSNQPPYKTLAYIQFQKDKYQAGVLQAFL